MASEGCEYHGEASFDPDEIDADARLTAVLASTFREVGLSADEWVARLRDGGMHAVRLTSLKALRSAHQRPEHTLDVTPGAPTFQFLRRADHPVGCPLIYFGPCAVRVAGGRGLTVPLAPAPHYGAQTIKCLRAVGVDVSRLVHAGVASTGWCKSYLPAAAKAPSAHAKCVVKVTPTETTLPTATAQSMALGIAIERPPQRPQAPPSATAGVTPSKPGATKAVLGLLRKKKKSGKLGVRFEAELAKPRGSSVGGVGAALVGARSRRDAAMATATTSTASMHSVPASAVSATNGHTAPAGTSSATMPSSCPICLGPMWQPIELTCSHALCTSCASDCNDSGHERCPICRHPHLLDPTLLSLRRQSWRDAYGGWRRGASSGAVGEVSSVVLPRRFNAGTSHNGSHSWHAGDLFVLADAANGNGKARGRSVVGKGKGVVGKV